MERLPVEIQEEIIIRLDGASLFQSSMVCKLWREYSLKHVKAIDDFYGAGLEGDLLSLIKSNPENSEVSMFTFGTGREDTKNSLRLFLIATPFT